MDFSKSLTLTVRAKIYYLWPTSLFQIVMVKPLNLLPITILCFTNILIACDVYSLTLFQIRLLYVIVTQTIVKNAYTPPPPLPPFPLGVIDSSKNAARSRVFELPSASGGKTICDWSGCPLVCKNLPISESFIFLDASESGLKM